MNDDIVAYYARRGKKLSSILRDKVLEHQRHP